MRAVLVLGMLVGGAAAAPPAIAPSAAAKLLGVEPSDDVEAMIGERYAGDAKAKALALALYRDTGDVEGVGRDEIMDGGYRGKIHLVPELPVGKYREHLAWVAAAMTEIGAFFDGFSTAPSYRWRALAFQFVRSVGKRTPSAYASSWSIVYNVAGSLLTSETGVRDTLFHELFHLNDEQHGGWSEHALGKDYATIVQKCGTKLGCLAPYAPNDTRVRGGTYYAFQPDNGEVVHEYAAELAVRYFKEQTEIRAHHKLSHPAFKCGPAENARAWRAIVDEFFAGEDLVPDCTER